MKPKVSVIIRTFNSREFVERAISSALDQSFGGGVYEVIVVDDGSTDGTINIVRGFNKKIRAIESEHAGPVSAINVGIKNSSTPFVILLDSDDMFEKNCIEELYSRLNLDKKAAFAYCDYWEHSRNNTKKVVSLGDNIFNSIAEGIMFRKEILFKVGLYDEELIFPEYDILIKIMNQKYKGAHVATPLFHYIRRENSITADRGLVARGLKQLEERYGTRYPIREY